MSDEKWAVITGASQGIGRAMAAEAARRGLNLFLIALPETGLPAVADELSRLYDVEAEPWEMDLSDSIRIAEFADYVGASRPIVELLVNNASIGGTSPFARQKPFRRRDSGAGQQAGIRISSLATQSRGRTVGGESWCPA